MVDPLKSNVGAAALGFESVPKLGVASGLSGGMQVQEGLHGAPGQELGAPGDGVEEDAVSTDFVAQHGGIAGLDMMPRGLLDVPSQTEPEQGTKTSSLHDGLRSSGSP